MYDVLALRRANPIAAVIEDAGVSLRSVGSRLTGRCPLHADAKPSLMVYPETQSYFCFGCQAGGDVIDFVSRQRKVSFKEAAAFLSGVNTVSVRPAPAASSATRNRSVTPGEAKVIDFAVGLFHEAFWQSGHARISLRRRGIDESTAHCCMIGFGLASLADDLQRAGLSLGAARNVGLLSGDRNAFAGRLIVPNLANGRATWLTGRSVNGEGPRYLNLRLPSPLLGLGQESNDLVLTEGPLDWLTLRQWGCPAAALVGTRPSKEIVRILRTFGRVYLAFDNDDAGRRATAALLEALGSRAVPVHLPDFAQDVNDLLSYPDGEGLFRECITKAMRSWEGK